MLYSLQHQLPTFKIHLATVPAVCLGAHVPSTVILPMGGFTISAEGHMLLRPEHKVGIHINKHNIIKQVQVWG